MSSTSASQQGLRPAHGCSNAQDNEYIKGYYRHSMPVRDSIKSLFGLHNETGNIYTHLLGVFRNSEPHVSTAACILRRP